MSKVKTEMYYRAIHSQVIVVYSANIPEAGDAWSGDWAAYVVPVQSNKFGFYVAQQEASRTWRERGCKLKEDEAKALWPDVAADFGRRNLKWRR